MPTSSILSARPGSLKGLQKISPPEILAILGHFDGYFWNMDTEGRYILFNEALEDKVRELTGITIRTGEKVQDFPSLMDSSMRPVWDRICALARRGEQIRMVQELRVKGQPAFFELSAIPIWKGEGIAGISCLVKDLTVPTMNERKLRGSESRFRSLIEKGSDIIVLVDGEGRIVYASPSIENYFGIKDAEQLGNSAFQYIHPDDVGRLAEKFLEVLESPNKPIYVETKAVTKEKNTIWVEGTVTNLLGVEGIHGIVCNFRDVTARKVAERQLIQATIDAQDKEREEIGRELHDNVNQILTTARLYLDCIVDASDGQQEMIQRSSTIISSAIEEIRNLSRSMTQAFHPELGLKLSIEDLVENIRRLSDGMQINLEFRMPAEKDLDNKFKMTLFRIIQEQLNNVLKHSEARTVAVSVCQQQDQIQLRIADDGRGFDPELKREGIGLSNITNRAESFQGIVSLDTAPGKGCVLSVHFDLKKHGG